MNKDVAGISNRINTRLVLSLFLSYLNLDPFLIINYFLLILSSLFRYLTFDLIFYFCALCFCPSRSVISILFLDYSIPSHNTMFIFLFLVLSISFSVRLYTLYLSQHFSPSCLFFFRKPVSHDHLFLIHILKFKLFCLGS